MSCLDENTLVAFFSRDRTSSLLARVEGHTAECAACRDLVLQYARMSEDGGTAHTHEASQRMAAAAPSLTPAIPNRKPDDTVADAERTAKLAHERVQKQIGTTLKGKWHIDRLLGIGGMAYVFAAQHRNGRRVAIKCMRPELTLEHAFVERFLREGYVANKVEHPGAVAVLDDDVMDDGTPFLVMEFLSGTTLRERLISGTLEIGQALAATSDLLDVLAAAHDKGIVHRDLKPDNVFLTDDGVIKVLDFGIARLREPSANRHETQVGTTMGTLGFMPPEQARGLIDQIDARSDVWAVGATLYALLTGATLHVAATQNESLLLAMTTAVPPMAKLAPWIPAPVRAVLDRALAFDKAARFSDARSMKQALDGARGSVTGNHALTARTPPALTELMPSHASASLLGRAFARTGGSGYRAASHGTGRSHVLLAFAAAVMSLVILGVFGLAVFTWTAPVRARAAAAPSAETSSGLVASPAHVSSASPALPTSQASAVASASSAPIPAAAPTVVASSTKPTAARRPTGTPSPTPTIPTAPNVADTRDPLSVRH